jgi:hypothetical protein
MGDPVKIALAAAMIGALVLGGCSERGEAPQPDARGVSSAGGPAASGGKRRAVDVELVAFLSKARAAHHSADLAESIGDLPLAVRHLEAVANGRRPQGVPEVDEVMADVRARLADLKSRMEKFDDAIVEIERGLSGAAEVSHYRGHLFEVRGVVEERRMKHLEKLGDKAGAEKARKAALDAFEMAIEIQDEVILRLVPDPPE